MRAGLSSTGNCEDGGHCFLFSCVRMRKNRKERKYMKRSLIARMYAYIYRERNMLEYTK